MVLAEDSRFREVGLAEDLLADYNGDVLIAFRSRRGVQHPSGAPRKAHILALMLHTECVRPDAIPSQK